MSESETQERLIDDAVGGDRAALERLLLDHSEALMQRVAGRLPASLRGAVDAADIVQLTFAQVFQSIGRYEKRDDASFFSWLATIAENQMLDAIRAQKRKKRGGDFQQVRGKDDEGRSDALALIDALCGDSQTPSRALAREEAIQAIQIAVAGLDDDYRRAVQLRYFEGYSLEETAQRMDRTTGAVRGLLDRAKKRMRETLDRASKYLSSK